MALPGIMNIVEQDVKSQIFHPSSYFALPSSKAFGSVLKFHTKKLDTANSLLLLPFVTCYLSIYTVTPSYFKYYA